MKNYLINRIKGLVPICIFYSDECRKRSEESEKKARNPEGAFFQLVKEGKVTLEEYKDFNLEIYMLELIRADVDKQFITLGVLAEELTYVLGDGGATLNTLFTKEEMEIINIGQTAMSTHTAKVDRNVEIRNPLMKAAIEKHLEEFSSKSYNELINGKKTEGQ